jgi:hypothetical protein
MLRTGKTPALRREAPPVAEVGAGTPANNREIGHFCTASISQATLQRTETAELTGKTKLV